MRTTFEATGKGVEILKVLPSSRGADKTHQHR
jgi:hypothetical protein